MIETITRFRNEEQEQHDIGLENDEELAPGYQLLSGAISMGQKLHMGLVKNVSNTKQVKDKVIKEELACTMASSCLVPSTLVVVTAANKACLAYSRGAMKTRSINTEILFNLSSSSNITDSLNKFGGQDADTTFLVVSVDKGLDEDKDVIEGDWVDTSNLSDQINEDLLVKVHRLKVDTPGQSLCSPSNPSSPPSTATPSWWGTCTTR